MVTLEQYKEQLSEIYNPDELVDVLNISTDELLERFHDKVVDKFDREINTLEPSSEEDM